MYIFEIIAFYFSDMYSAIGFLLGFFIFGPIECFFISYLPTKTPGMCGTCKSYENQEWCGVGVCHEKRSWHVGVVNHDSC